MGMFLIMLVAVALYVMSMSMRSKKSRKNAYWLEVLSLVLVAVYVLPKVSVNFDSMDAAWGSMTTILVAILVVCAIVNKLLFHKK